MPRRVSPRLMLCLPPAFVWAADTALTLHGQPPGYWARFGGNPPSADVVLGSYGYAARELAPIARALLERHPLAFVAGAVAELAAVALLIGLLPARLALVVCLTATLGHTWGSTGWVAEFPHGYQLAHVYLLIVAAVSAVSLQAWFVAAASVASVPPRTPAWLRGALIGASVFVLVYLFVWPHPG